MQPKREVKPLLTVIGLTTMRAVCRITFMLGVVGCGEGVLYLTSPGRPTAIGLQLGKACCPCSR